MFEIGIKKWKGHMPWPYRCESKHGPSLEEQQCQVGERCLGIKLIEFDN